MKKKNGFFKKNNNYQPENEKKNNVLIDIEKYSYAEEQEQKSL